MITKKPKSKGERTMITQQPSLASINYKASGSLDSAIYDGTDRNGKIGYIILVRRYSEFVVARYFDGDESWLCGDYYRTYDEALAQMLRTAMERWGITEL